MDRHTPPLPNDPTGRLYAKLNELESRVAKLEHINNEGGASFTSLPYENWKDFGAGWTLGGYSRDSTGLVRLTGLITPITEGAPNGEFSNICSLPEGYRPGTATLHMTSINGTGVARITITKTGPVILESSSLGNFKPGDFVSLWDISFYAGN